jgi:hypothetical protein
VSHVDRRWRGSRTAKACGPDASTLASGDNATHYACGDNQARSPGRARHRPLKPFACGNAGFSGGLVVDLLVCFFTFTHEAAGALGARHSPRPFGRQVLDQLGCDACRGKGCACVHPSRRIAEAMLLGMRPGCLRVDEKGILSLVITGHSRSENGVASARLRPGDPRLPFSEQTKTWMAGSSPAMTKEQGEAPQRHKLFDIRIRHHARRRATPPPPATRPRRARACRDVRGGRSRDGRSLLRRRQRV